MASIATRATIQLRVWDFQVKCSDAKRALHSRSTVKLTFFDHVLGRNHALQSASSPFGIPAAISHDDPLIALLIHA